MKRMLKALILSVIALLAVAAGFFAVDYTGTFTNPVQGPEWRVCLRSIHENLAEGLEQYADDHEGRLPDDLRVLAGEYILAMPSPAAGRRWWWVHAFLTWGAISGVIFFAALCVLTKLGSRRCHIGLAACLSASVVCCWSRRPWFPTAPSYDYLDRFAVIPGLRRPLPRGVPVIWAQRPYERLGRSPNYCVMDAGTPPWQWGLACYFNVERLFELLATARADRATLVASAEKGDLHALLVLATTPELRAGDTFVRILNGGYAHAIALMGLHNLDDPRTVVEARKALLSKDSDVRDHAVKLLEHIEGKAVLVASQPRLGQSAPALKTRLPLTVKCPAQAVVFDRCELRVRLPEKLAALSDAQVHDAYDADRDGVCVRLVAEFRHADGHSMVVPGFAMRGEAGGDWQWRVRWSPQRAGEWSVKVSFDARRSSSHEAIKAGWVSNRPIVARVEKGIGGPLATPKGSEHPGYLRRLRADGTSQARWLFGACRAWVAEPGDQSATWSRHEWIDRETELFAPMREGGYNLLNQWMAPWEFLLVHHDRAERWREGDGSWRRHPLGQDAAWSPYQCYDQGRAHAFDQLVTQCEGGPDKATIHLLLSPLPHQCLQVKEHPWGAQESGWSPDNDAGKQSLERLNGFSALRPNLSVWEFFDADPARPLDDWRSQLFDHQANFLRYVIARWGYSRAIGIWVLVDELDAVGDVVGVMSEQEGWWGHPQCGRWLANVVRLFRGELLRHDGLRYQGDPFRHPLHAATTSFGGEAGRGGNLDWPGGPEDARPDLFGWHWYPWWSRRTPWSDVWTHTIDGVTSYSQAPIGTVPRLISEFGAPDRDDPSAIPSPLYPTLYHHAIWSAIFAGQAGTPMDWDDGKEFGELRWRPRKGAFDREHYPIDHVAQLQALRRFLSDLRPGTLACCLSRNAEVECTPGDNVRVHALYPENARDALYGWLFTLSPNAHFSITGLRPGRYRLAWYDPWTGERITGLARQSIMVRDSIPLQLAAGPALAKLMESVRLFPQQSRLSKGQDVAFKLVGR